MENVEIEKQVLCQVKCVAAGELDSISLLGRFHSFESLTREMVEIFIRQVYICKDGNLRIEWRFKDFLEIFSLNLIYDINVKKK